MTTESLLGTDLKPLRFKVIRPVYEVLSVHEEIEEYLESDEAITSSSRVAQMFGFLRRETKEHFWAIHLDSKNRMLCIDPVSTGSLNASVVHPREIFKSALLSSCAAMILLHNHPSGDPQPSCEDITITERLKDSSELLGIRLLDHVIIGDGRHHSFADSGLL